MSKTTLHPKQYCVDLFDYKQFQTREVYIGDTPLGANNPIRVQSMTITDTMDTEATVQQTLDLAAVDCEYVRITAPSKKEAENLAKIKKRLEEEGCTVPLVADIHFTPNAAEVAARIVEKVRVNPGNYADKKKFEEIEYTDDSYQEELERIREKFTPLVKICKEEGIAMRIGTNHGSLSDRIMSRYGDTPEGMVESAMEFARICRDHDYHELVFSMKASNPKVMVEAYRLLVRTMMQNDYDYPIHLGVTEAGDGEDGRIKSAVGIGALLEDGIGDTIRVSLTEDPEAEIPVARKLVERYAYRPTGLVLPSIEIPEAFEPFHYHRRKSVAVENLGGDKVPVVICDLSGQVIDSNSVLAAGYSYDESLDKYQMSETCADYVYAGIKEVDPDKMPGNLGFIVDAHCYSEYGSNKNVYPLFSIDQWLANDYTRSPRINFVQTDLAGLLENASKLQALENTVLVFNDDHPYKMATARRMFFEILAHKIDVPVVLKTEYVTDDEEQVGLYAAIDHGGLQIDGFGDGVWVVAEEVDAPALNRISFNILQATRSRISKTEYISCPSCGRTLFDLQDTTALIKERTDHLKGVKIGIMGCIVNGPGEMADADYGYVGSGVDKITLYKGQVVVKRNVPANGAVDELITLIKDHGDWVEPA